MRDPPKFTDLNKVNFKLNMHNDGNHTTEM